jgi:hypothetical protein
MGDAGLARPCSYIEARSGSVAEMLDPEASRQTAHIFLDAAAVHHRDDPTADDVRDEMTGLAFERLTEVGSIRLTQDDETGAMTLDIARAGTGILAVIIACLDGWAACSGVDRDELIIEVRRIVDANLVE